MEGLGTRIGCPIWRNVWCLNEAPYLKDDLGQRNGALFLRYFGPMARLVQNIEVLKHC